MEDSFHMMKIWTKSVTVRKKKLAKKEEIAKAKNFLEDLKLNITTKSS